MNASGKKIKQWTSDHKKEILLVAGSAVVVGGAAALFHCHRVNMLNTRIRVQDLAIHDMEQRIATMKMQHHELCMQKDAAYRALMSDALRHGSSMGGEEMASWKAYMRAADAVA